MGYPVRRGLRSERAGAAEVANVVNAGYSGQVHHGGRAAVKISIQRGRPSPSLGSGINVLEVMGRVDNPGQLIAFDFDFDYDRLTVDQ